MNGDARLAALALALPVAGMSAAGRSGAGEDGSVRDPQQHNHQAWQASAYGRNWRAEAERQGSAASAEQDPPERQRQGPASATETQGKPLRTSKSAAETRRHRGTRSKAKNGKPL